MTIIEIKVPSDNEEGTTMKIQNWLKSIGDTVSKDEPLVEIETDKVTMEIEAPADGVLTEIISEIGQDVGVGAVIGKLSTAQMDGADPKPNTPPKAVADTPKSPPPNKQTSAPNPGLSPSVRRYVAQHNLDVSGLSGTPLSSTPMNIVPPPEFQNAEAAFGSLSTLSMLKGVPPPLYSKD